MQIESTLGAMSSGASIGTPGCGDVAGAAPPAGWGEVPGCSAPAGCEELAGCGSLILPEKAGRWIMMFMMLSAPKATTDSGSDTGASRQVSTFSTPLHTCRSNPKFSQAFMYSRVMFSYCMPFCLGSSTPLTSVRAA